ncbi:MAG: autotransporter-associated beta strand repeat-containing protein, partial [Planctomycetaceae bacterium]|nr:autotransporter-associated beta strand repeat-containing protein [Planctomycetaceae bacterium]
SPNRTLTKKGTGTLEIAAQNGNNIGNAVVENGTLQLTHSQAIGSNKKIFFQPDPNNNSARPVLELDFRDKAPGSEYDFGTQVGATGIGTLVKKGDNTVLLTNTNNNYGDTEIEEGILAITSQSVLGTGKVIFTGGTLQYRNTKVEAFNAELTSKSAGYNILLDTQNNMRITGKVSGDGSLVKTGAAVLTLAGSATYTGDTEVRQGTLAVESRNSIGNGMVILSDGAVFQNTTEMASTNEDLLDKSKERNEVKALRDNVLFDKDIEYSYKGIYNNIILDEDTDGNGIIEINLASAKSRLQLLTTEVAILTADRTQADEIRNDLIRKKGEPGADINDLNKKIAAKDAEIAALTNKINLAGAAIIGLDAQVSVKDTQIAGFNNQIAALDIEIASLLEANNGLTQDFVLNTAANGKVVDGNIIDTKEDLLISGTISGNGMLVKKGADKTLTLSGMNTYSGGTRIDEGTLAISQIDNLGTGNLIFNGGTLKNTFEISRFNKDIVVNSGKNAIFETEANLTINGGTITGKGGLVKTGDAMLTLTDTYSYTGTTLVQEGTLNLTGRIYSDTIVAKDAILRGKGIIAGNVKFESGSIYEWNAGYALADKDRLNVLGIVELNNTTFRAVTAGSDPSFFEYDLNGQEVLRYDRLTGDERFAKIDNSSSPFYIFSLDYSEPNVVKVITHKRSDALPLSDGVAVGLNLAQRRAHRKAFDRIDLSFSNARYTQPMSIDGSRLRNHQQAGGYRGQNAASTSNAWGEWYMRGTEYDSVFFSDNWRMWSFGFQGGFSFYANQNSEFGLTFGIEHPELKNGNGSDKIIANDGFFGLYYGQRLPRNWEFKGYIGGGTQRYESNRFDAAYKYKTKYYGESFQTNIEFSRPLRTPYFVIRPIFGFDLEYAQQESAYENRPGIGAEQRYYSKASMTQLFTKVGLDFHRPINCGDSYFGISYSNMIAGDSQSVVGVYYPNSKMSGEIRSAHLGQNVFTFRVGANHYLGGRDYSVLFWNFTADEYADRAGGKGEFSGTVGYTYRF